MMCKRLFIFCIFLYVQISASGQSDSSWHWKEKKGISLGIGIGAGSLSLQHKDFLSTTFSTSLPNIKIGYWVNKKTEIILLLPGANYKYQGKDRGFEAFLLGVEYWPNNKWWLLSAIGMTFDAAAFYTVKDPKTAEFYTGFPALAIGCGYEIWHKKHFALDLQFRSFYGKSYLKDQSSRTGISNMIILGFNWY